MFNVCGWIKIVPMYLEGCRGPSCPSCYQCWGFRGHWMILTGVYYPEMYVDGLRFSKCI